MRLSTHVSIDSAVETASLQRLFKAVQRQCDKPSAIIYHPFLKDVIERYNGNGLIRFLQVDDITEAPLNSFSTVVLMQILETMRPDEQEAMLDRAWGLVRNGGKLIAVVPNQHYYKHPQQLNEFERKTLKSLLRKLDRPKLHTEQPFCWLMMYVRKRSKPRQARISKDYRLEETAGFCFGKVLELGCGAGELTSAIHRAGYEVTGVDMNREKIETAKRNYPEIPFLQSNVLELKFPPSSFDTVLLPEILEHVPDDVGRKILDTAWNLVAPKGRLIVTVPNEDCIPHPNHIRVFDTKTLKTLLQSYGKPVLVTTLPYKWLMMYVDRR